MSTVTQVIDRLKRSFLVAPNNQPATTTSTIALTADLTDTQVTFGSFGLNEDEHHLMAGSVIELDRELMRIVTYDENTKIGEVIRAIDSTPLLAHDVNAQVTLAPPFARQSMYEAVSDNIVRLYPRLYTVRAEFVVAVGHGVYPVFDDIAVEVLTAWPEGQTFGKPQNVQSEMVDFHPLTDGRAVLCSLTSDSLWIRYRRRMKRPTDVTDLMSDLGVDDAWEEIVVVGAASDLAMNADLPYLEANFLSDVAENENIRFGSRTSVARALNAKRDKLLDEAMREMRAEYRPKVRRRSAWETTTRAGVG